MSVYFAEQGKPARYLIIDHDTKFTKGFDAILKGDGTEILRVGPKAPNMNAFAERFVQTAKHECLDHFVVFGLEHLRYIIKEFCDYYNEHRPHQSLGNVPISGTPPDLGDGPIACEERLGGLLKHYYRQAA